MIKALKTPIVNNLHGAILVEIFESNKHMSVTYTVKLTATTNGYTVSLCGISGVYKTFNTKDLFEAYDVIEEWDREYKITGKLTTKQALIAAFDLSFKHGIADLVLSERYYRAIPELRVSVDAANIMGGITRADARRIVEEILLSMRGI